jgi:hypothetical protein
MNIQTAKGASYDSGSSMQPFAPEDSMATVDAVDLPAGPPNPAIVLERGSPDPVEYEDPAPVAALLWPSPRPIEAAALADLDDDLKTARGFTTAILLSVPLWGLIGLLTWLIVRW